MRTAIRAAAARLRALGSGLRRIPWSGILVAALGIILMLWAVYSPPKALVGLFLEPSGAIYVSSPGVYTRERLVNDRNDQNYWLRSQMEQLDAHVIGYSTVTGEARAASATAGASRSDRQDALEPATTGMPEQGSEVETAAPELSFNDQFVLKSAWRDGIRHAILENLLDDRHDLTGNSVYGLRFNTTVYPGWHTTGRAFVRISISTDEAALTPGTADLGSTESGLPPLIETFYDSAYADVLHNTNNPNYSSYKLYTRWLDSVQDRLNAHIRQVYNLKCSCIGAGCQAILWMKESARTVDTVLATDGTVVRPTKLVDTPFALPDPLNRFLRITVDGFSGHRCDRFPQFSVGGISDALYLSSGEPAGANYVAIEETDDGDKVYYYLPSNADRSDYEPRSENIRSIAELAKEKGKLGPCPEGSENGSCLRHLFIPTGYFNFIRHVIRSDSYVYSLFPRSEADAVFNSRRGSGNLRYDVRGAGPVLSALMEFWEKSAGLARTSVGFADAYPSSLKDSDEGSITRQRNAMDFGWVIEVGTDTSPVQKAQFALVSVPAWASRLTVTVKSGWLGADSREIAARSYSYSVPVPPDYEAFDGFIGGQKSVRAPRISSQLMQPVDVVACREVRVLIPGPRLWRSALVTLGGQPADRITVLPNMGGIIARFSRLPPTIGEGNATLAVWTSEGVDMVTDKVRVTIPDGCGDAPADESPTADVVAGSD